MVSPGFGTPKTSLPALDETKGTYALGLNWCDLAIPSLEYQPEEWNHLWISASRAPSPVSGWMAVSAQMKTPAHDRPG